MNFRSIERNEIEKIRNLDRSEIIDQIYYYKNDELILVDEHHDISGWEPKNLEEIVSNLYFNYDRKATIYGAFEDTKMIGLVALDSEFIGKNNDTLLLDFLHVDKSYRKIGVGDTLFEMIAKKAKELGAKKLYISATPTKNTIQFYFNRGCELTEELNNKLYELEPEDIHLQFDLSNF